MHTARKNPPRADFFVLEFGKNINRLINPMIHTIRKQLYERSLGLLLIRLGVGLVFLMHGIMKLQNLAGINSFFVHLGLPAPIALLIALLETIGGIALIFGIFTRVFALLLGIEMIVAIFITN